MTKDAFRIWMDRLGLSASATAEALEADQKSIVRYINGTLEIPRIVALACWALEYGAPINTAPFTPKGSSRKIGEPKE